MIQRKYNTLVGKNRFSRIPFDLLVSAACEARRGRRLGRVLTGTMHGDCTALRPALGRYDRRHIQPPDAGQAFILFNKLLYKTLSLKFFLDFSL